jgi:MFS family permease
LLIGFYLLPGVVIVYPSGLLGRRLGDKRIAIFGMTLMVAGGALTASSYNYEIFLIGRLISGVGAVLLNMLLAKMVTDWFVGRELATALALLVSSWPVGIGVALIVLPPLARDFTDNPGAPLTFAGCLEIGANAMLLLLRLLERRHGTADRRRRNT